MRDQDDLPYIVIERHSAGLAPFLWGALIGAGAALLLAPRTGVETQEEIRLGVRRARGVAEEKVEAARSTVNRTRERLETQIGSVRDQLGTVRERIETRADEARDALDNSRRAARDEIDRRVSSLKNYRGEGAAAAGDEMAASQRDQGVDVVLTDVTEEPTEGRSDLG